MSYSLPPDEGLPSSIVSKPLAAASAKSSTLDTSPSLTKRSISISSVTSTPLSVDGGVVFDSMPLSDMLGVMCRSVPTSETGVSGAKLPTQAGVRLGKSAVSDCTATSSSDFSALLRLPACRPRFRFGSGFLHGEASLGTLLLADVDGVGSFGSHSEVVRFFC